jgi:hypothetical protein
MMVGTGPGGYRHHDVIGHVLGDRDGARNGTPAAGRLRAEDLTTSEEVSAARFVRVSARSAVVLRDPLPASPEPSMVFSAIGGLFLAAAFRSATPSEDGTPDGVVLDDHMIDHRGPLPVSLRVGAGAPVEVVLTGGEQLLADLADLAAAEGGLPAGHLVLPAPVERDRPVAVRPGVIEIRGPLDTTLAVGVTS